MVQLPDRTPLISLAQVRRDLHLSRDFEFKYVKSKPRQKVVFLDAVRALTFRVRAVVLDKSNMPARFRLSGHELTIELIAQLTVRASALDVANDVLIIDGGTPRLRRDLRIRLSYECRISGRTRPFGKIVGSRSSQEEGLQLADMVAGAIREHLADGVSDYYDTFANKVVDLWVPGREK